MPRREQIVLAGLCSVLGTCQCTTQAADLDPVTIGSWGNDTDAIREIRAVAVAGHHAYLACGQAGLQILNVQDLDQPKAVSRYVPEPVGEYRPSVGRVAVSGDYAYLEAGGRLEVIDIHDPLHPIRVGVNDNGWGSSAALAVVANYAYMVNAESSVQVFDVSDPTDPRWVALLPVKAQSLATAGKYLCLGTEQSFEIWDVAAPTVPERVGVTPIAGRTRSLVWEGNYALVAREGVAEPGQSVPPGLEIIDIQQPGNPQAVGRYETDGPALAVAVVGQRAFLAVDSGLTVIDISDPAQPRRLASYENGLSPMAVAAEGDTCYFASGLAGWGHFPLGATLDLIDISQPANPRRRSTFADPPGAADVAISGRFAYLADGLAGLRVIDIGDSARPTSMGWIPAGVNTHAVTVSGRLACVAFRGSGDGDSSANRRAGWVLMDITDPTNPSVVSRNRTAGPPEDIVLVGNYLFAAFATDGEDGLQVFDVSDPVRPRRAGGFSSGFGRGLAVSGNHLFIAASGLQVFDISNPTSPTRVAWLGGEVDANAVAITGHFACVTDWNRGLHVVDISDPNNPRPRGRRAGSNWATVAASGNLAWAGEELIDISDPTNPRRVAGGPTGTVVVLVDPLAYVGEAHGGLNIVDLGHAANPQRVGTNPRIYSSSDVEVVGRYAYLASWDKGLQVVDLTNSTRPEPVGWVASPGVARGVTVQGAFAYLAGGTAGLRVVDISNPGAPRLAGAAATVEEAFDVAVSGAVACIALGNGGMQVVDITNPLHPLPIGRYDSTVGAQRVAVSGNRAYVVSGHPLLEVIDVSQPASPRSIAGPYSVDSLGFPTSVPVGYADDPEERWLLSDLTDPSQPKLIGGYRTIAKALGIALSDHYACKAGYNWELERPQVEVYDLSDRSRPQRIGQNSSTRYPTALAVADGRIWVAGDNYQGLGEGLVVLEMLPFIKSIAHQQGQVHLDWEGWGRARLEGTTNLAAPDWQDVGIPETTNRVSLPGASPYAFFRLRKR